MKTRAAVLTELNTPWEILECDLEGPRQGEITVKIKGSGLCHSEIHISAGRLAVGHLPICCGHEGAGVVVEVGPETPGFVVGDHVILSALPFCGYCRWCQSGHSNLCDLSRHLMTGGRFEDPPTFRLSHEGERVGQIVGIGAFSELTTVSTMSVVKIDPEVPLDRACLIGCAVATGWGSAVNLGSIEPGNTVIVMGTGGLGVFAVQGAVHAGATNVIGVDPLLDRHAQVEALGATHTCASIEEGTDLARSMTNGQGADTTIITVGNLERDMISQALTSVRKGGTVVVTGLGDQRNFDYPFSMVDLTLSQKRLQGSQYGGIAMGRDMPRLIDMYRRGHLKLDEVITRRYTLDEINKGYEDLEAGLNLRGVITFD
ncbi:NDMA-dependent alcohol dehydrogenase [Mycobacterium sp. UM_CSW]|uniref:NDMA-dependent alcohol dehydrogenase n=1 Tax=Mycobacterium sp. UM_CSW TaxID=1370119 RepID=UPI000424431D|nr:NDMA-dependent alcohol dehydrogenase [Mycobacterium sp. UM_CSW]